jgi:hypothetical protein
VSPKAAHTAAPRTRLRVIITPLNRDRLFRDEGNPKAFFPPSEPLLRGSGMTLVSPTTTWIVLPAGATSLTFLQLVYRDHRQPMSARLKAAGLAIDFEHPKFAVTAVVTEGDIAARIDRARARSAAVIKARLLKEARLLAPPAAPTTVAPPPSGRLPTPLGAPFNRIRRV